MISGSMGMTRRDFSGQSFLVICPQLLPPAAAAGELSTLAAETSFTSACESSMASSASVRAARQLPTRLAAPAPPLAFAFGGILAYQFKKIVLKLES